MFITDMQWGEQPVRLTALAVRELPQDAPTTSVHIVAFQGERVLVVRDRRGAFGFPGGRLEEGESYEAALEREVYEEARARLKPEKILFAVLKIEWTQRLAHRTYPYDYSYMAMYTGQIRALEPIGADPAGVITGRDLFTCADCERLLPENNRILLRQALCALSARPEAYRRTLRAFAAMLREGRK
ncbi:MAG: NUDIX domain-containing protein [Chloroherpetonaceae bacterium]|nr:NUDIX domain-containing protein [Chthonomonadaceae bacterium]MDW8208168.1 NUDIX domain-containing protein [Chloroherpetonaceae bacterium]